MILDADFEGKTDLNIRALEVVEELRTKRADKQLGKMPRVGRFTKKAYVDIACQQPQVGGHGLQLRREQTANSAVQWQ
ncbi:hypothetical protein Ahy_B03g066668 [Arachis hypogaea]|uniref:Uncharacterized protein n=1 Tax=Arachis hypogaea TaxID=3818 RepID=A0A445A4K7_ARAHY|nr:hypothetical protein Ahy_B03g066668 [Arachis hypogaea]